MHRHTLLLAALLATCLPRWAAAAELPAAAASAPAEAASAPAPTAPIKVRRITVHPGEKGYTAELAATGAQGDAEVLARVDATGVPTEPKIHTSSLSPALDAAALELVRGLSFKVREGAGDSLQVLVPVEFVKDTLEHLGQKTCGDLNTDIAYFTATFPGKDAAEMKVFRMTTGMFVLAAVAKRTVTETLAFTKILKAAYPKAISACRAQPEARFVDTLKQAIKDGGG
jgi:TonB family protein